MSLENSREERWDRLVAEYRDACPEIEGSANFMPGVWQRIEARRRGVFAWGKMSRRVLAAAAAICFLFGVVLNTAIQSALPASSYVEVLDDDDDDALDQLHPASYSPDGDRE